MVDSTGVVLAAGEVDFVKPWETLMRGLGSSWDNVFTFAAVVGVVLIIMAIGTFFWKKRRGGGGGGIAPLVVALIIGGMLAGPKAVIPLFLKIGELAISGIIALGNFLFG